MTWYLRSASLKRVDLFEGNVRRRQGEVYIYGGNVRNKYEPHEVRIVPKKHLDEIRNIIEEHQHDLRAITNPDDFASIRQRDNAEIAFGERVRWFVAEKCVKPNEADGFKLSEE